MKKFLALLLAVLMVASFAACGQKGNDGGAGKDTTPSSDTTPSGGDKTPSDDTTPGGDAEPSGEVVNARDTLNCVYTSDKGTLYPLLLLGNDSLAAVMLCYDPLWDWNQAGERVYKLCTEVEFEDEGKTWIIHLREGVKFSNGNPMNADDVVFTIDKAQNREGEPAYFPKMEECVALDEYTVKLTFSEFDLIYDTSITTMQILDKESFDQTSIMTTPIGTGPYNLVDYVTNSHIKFEKKPDGEYWGECNGCKYINFTYITEASQKTNALVTDTVDLCQVPFQDADYVADTGTYDIVDMPASNAFAKTLYFNTEKSEALNTPEARTAIAMAIDREAINDICYGGKGQVSVAAISAKHIDFPQEMAGYGVYGTGYDPEGAKALAEKCGLIGKTVSISTNGSALDVTVAECIQTDLNAIGINVDIRNYDAGSWLAIAFDSSACGDMLVDFTGSQAMTCGQSYAAWYRTHMGGAFTRSEFEGKERFASICDIINHLMTPEEYKAYYIELNKIQTDAMLWFSLVDTVAEWAVNKDLAGFQMMRMGHIDYQNMYWTK